MIIARPTFNRLVVALSNLYLCMEYSLLNGRVGVVRGDKKIARKYYAESLKFKKGAPSRHENKESQLWDNAAQRGGRKQGSFLFNPVGR